MCKPNIDAMRGVSAAATVLVIYSELRFFMLMVRRHTERWADKTPGREHACGWKDRFVLSYSVVFGSFNGLRGLPSVGIGIPFCQEKGI